TSDRSYKKALSFEEAAAELRKHAGGQFDPAIIAAFAKTSLDFWIAEKLSIQDQLHNEPGLI
ncbi:MAG: hypothetical protein JXO51_09905, partial [Candidatus Aminicenantes bacterium]|nr:hypothetical protein [Candidatus Aminicenantes bacterium]